MPIPRPEPAEFKPSYLLIVPRDESSSLPLGETPITRRFVRSLQELGQAVADLPPTTPWHKVMVADLSETGRLVQRELTPAEQEAMEASPEETPEDATGSE